MKMFVRLCVPVALAILMQTAHGKQPFEIKGVRIGMTEQEAAKVTRSLGQRKCEKLKDDSYQDARCYVFLESFAGKRAAMTYGLLQGRVVSVMVFVNHDHFSVVKDALIAKYGPPTAQETRVYENAFGAKLEGQVLRWSENPDDPNASVVRLDERGPNLNRSTIFMSSPATNDLQHRFKTEKSRQRADDL
jgi:hypothetical protein